MLMFIIFICFCIIFFGGRAVVIHFNNPLPTLENGDKRFTEVKQIKTRKIGVCNEEKRFL